MSESVTFRIRIEAFNKKCTDEYSASLIKVRGDVDRIQTIIIVHIIATQLFAFQRKSKFAATRPHVLSVLRLRHRFHDARATVPIIFRKRGRDVELVSPSKNKTISLRRLV